MLARGAERAVKLADLADRRIGSEHRLAFAERNGRLRGAGERACEPLPEKECDAERTQDGNEGSDPGDDRSAPRRRFEHRRWDADDDEPARSRERVKKS